MDIINAAESALKARMDGYAFKINGCVQNQDSPESLDRLLSLLGKYSIAAGDFQILQNIKTQLSQEPPTQPQEPEVNTEHEN